jgi:FKBP-type peptidyl-prolyl cis-trans isomerase FkpA
MKITTHILLLAACAFLLGSCKFEDQAMVDQEKIEQYLADNKLNATRHSSGIYYIIPTPGTGGSPGITSTVTVQYKGYLLNKNVFDQSTKPIQFPLSNLIEGWKICIPLLQKGGKGTFFIPSQLGYGPSGTGSIPGNSVLVFEIDLIDWK